jgi:hypothetical protein
MDGISTAPQSYVAAMLHFFGKKHGRTTQEFAQELKTLSESDKAEFKQALIERGYNIV